MQWRRWGALSIGILAAAALIAGARPARLRLARVTHVSAATPPMASISLLYARGARPQCVVQHVTRPPRLLASLAVPTGLTPRWRTGSAASWCCVECRLGVRG
ncbi:MAG: hypothetical protein RMJ55_14940 [Roseiflexaceae bacterium]|nr:hypothetical protein [Roseiflexaceae bacterium]